MAEKKAKVKVALKRRKKIKSQTKRAGVRRGEAASQPRTKTEACIALLMRPAGATLEELQKLTGWLPHSVRGFLAGTVKKLPGVALSSEKSAGESRRYRVTRAPP